MNVMDLVRMKADCAGGVGRYQKQNKTKKHAHEMLISANFMQARRRLPFWAEEDSQRDKTRVSA